MGADPDFPAVSVTRYVVLALPQNPAAGLKLTRPLITDHVPTPGSVKESTQPTPSHTRTDARSISALPLGVAPFATSNDAGPVP